MSKTARSLLSRSLLGPVGQQGGRERRENVRLPLFLQPMFFLDF